MEDNALPGSEDRQAYMDALSEDDQIEAPTLKNRLSRAIERFIAVFLVLSALELMLIIGLCFWRILFGLYHADSLLFVEALNNFGSNFFSGVAVGAGGLFAAIKIAPRFLVRR